MPETKRLLELIIESGETTCASEVGVFCPYFVTQRFGSISYCKLFSDYATDFGSFRYRFESLEEKDGWIQRHPRCLEADKG